MQRRLEIRAQLDGTHERDVFALTGLIAAGHRAGDVLRSLIRDDDKTARADLEVLVERPGPLGPDFVDGPGRNDPGAPDYG